MSTEASRVTQPLAARGPQRPPHLCLVSVEGSSVLGGAREGRCAQAEAELGWEGGPQPQSESPGSCAGLFPRRGRWREAVLNRHAWQWLSGSCSSRSRAGMSTDRWARTVHPRSPLKLDRPSPGRGAWLPSTPLAEGRGAWSPLWSGAPTSHCTDVGGSNILRDPSFYQRASSARGTAAHRRASQYFKPLVCVLSLFFALHFCFFWHWFFS